MQADEIKRLRGLEQENARLKKLVAERDLAIEVMKETSAKKVVNAPARRRQVDYALRRGLSERKACALMSVARSTLRYAPRMPARDAPVLAAMMSLSAQNQLEMALTDPGKPWQNGMNETLQRQVRDECLSMKWFPNRSEAKAVISTWRKHYNEIRPHSRLDQRTPSEFARGLQPTKPEPIIQE